jgi:hypothetical protein
MPLEDGGHFPRFFPPRRWPCRRPVWPRSLRHQLRLRPWLSLWPVDRSPVSLFLCESSRSHREPHCSRRWRLSHGSSKYHPLYWQHHGYAFAFYRRPQGPEVARRPIQFQHLPGTKRRCQSFAKLCLLYGFCLAQRAARRTIARIPTWKHMSTRGAFVNRVKHRTFEHVCRGPSP